MKLNLSDLEEATSAIKLKHHVLGRLRANSDKEPSRIVAEKSINNLIIAREVVKNHRKISDVATLTLNTQSLGGVIVVRPRIYNALQKYEYPNLTPWVDNDPATPNKVLSTPSSNLVGNNQVLMLDPFQAEFEGPGDIGDEANNIQQTLKSVGFSVIRKQDQLVTIEDFKQLSRYGIVSLFLMEEDTIHPLIQA